jgi:peptidoglycan/LPS O-acetylase OafA/YrhL
MLRALAAALVLLAHSQNFLHARGHVETLNPWIHFGSVGVDIFFVISGFIMVFVSSGKFQQAGASTDFLVRRIIRVVPMYWLYTLLIAALLFVFPQYFSGGKHFDSTHFLASLFFVPWPNNVGAVKPVLGVGWTLNSEMYFYVIFAFLLFAPSRLFLPILSLVLLSGIALTFFPGADIDQLSVIRSPLVVEFLIGSAIGILYMQGVHVPKALAAVLVTAGLAGMLFSSTPASAVFGISAQHPVGDYERLIKWGIPSGLLITGIVYLERHNLIKPNRLLVRLGDSSYSLYLTHIFVINAIGVLWIRLFHDHYDALIATTFLVAIALGHIAYLAIEKPVTVFLTESYRRRRRSGR